MITDMEIGLCVAKLDSIVEKEIKRLAENLVKRYVYKNKKRKTREVENKIRIGFENMRQWA